ncbi:MAG: hypothetical protein ACKVZH_13710 [Blastocatellia bacterium]
MEKNPPNPTSESQSIAKTPQALPQEASQAFAEFVRILAGSGVSAALMERSSSGPLPAPETLEKYKQVSPEALSLILREYGEEGPHRRKNEERILNDGILMARLGLLSAFLITLLFLSAGFYLILHGHDVAGASICGAGLVSVVVAFLRHTSQSRDKGSK